MPTCASMNEEADIQWGTVKNRFKAKIYYNSFISEGIEYELYDNVEVNSDDPSHPHIGKIIKLWEEKDKGLRKVLIRWFFKLKDLDQDMEGDPRELYLAFGTGKGVTNENDLEVICGKSKVLCTSKDTRNMQPSVRDLKNADFFFSKIYNVDLQHLSPVQKVVDKLGCEAVYNKPEWVTESSKSKANAVEQGNGVQDNKKSSLVVKQEAQCLDGPASDLKNGQRNSAATNEADNTCQASGLKRKRTNDMMQEVSESKKSKMLPNSNTPSIKLTTANRIQKTSATTMNPNFMPTNMSSLGKAESSKRPTLIAATTDQILMSEKVQKSDNVSSCKDDTSKLPHLVALATNTVQKSENISPSDTDSNKRPTSLAAATKRVQKSENIFSLDEAQASMIPSVIETAPKKIEKSENVSTMGKAEVIKIPTLVATPTKRIQESDNVSSLCQAEESKIPTLVMTTTNKIQMLENISSLGDAVLSKNVSSLRQAVGSKITSSCGIVQPTSSGIGQEKHMETELAACVPPTIDSSLSFRKATVSETPSPKVDDLPEQKAVPNTVGFDKGRTDLNVIQEAFVDLQKVRVTLEGQQSSFSDAKNASGLLRGDAEQNLHANGEIKSFARDSNAKGQTEGTVQTDHKVGISIKRKVLQAKGDSCTSQDPGSVFKESVVKEAVLDDVTRTRIGSTGSDLEKRLSSTAEATKVVENRRIFKVLNWADNLQQGIIFEKVLLLQNLDPCLTSAEFCDMLKKVLQGVSDAQTLPQDTGCPYGQGLVIFESRLLAESALQEMERKCLVMANHKRPIIASKFKEPIDLPRFPGHLALEKMKLSKNLGTEEYKKAVSSSHCSQPNTIEFEMAIEWRRLQEIIQTCRAELFERQRKEMEQVRKGGSSEDL